MALQEIKKECLLVCEMKLFNTKIGRAVRFEEYKQLQEAETSATKEHLKSTWILELVGSIRNHFQEIDKGWFNIKVS